MEDRRNGQPPPGGPPSQAPGEEELTEEQKLALEMVHAAMLEELGIGRKDTLPLADKGPQIDPSLTRRLAETRSHNQATAAWRNFQPDDVDPNEDMLDSIADGQLYRLRRGGGNLTSFPHGISVRGGRGGLFVGRGRGSPSVRGGRGGFHVSMGRDAASPGNGYFGLPRGQSRSSRNNGHNAGRPGLNSGISAVTVINAFPGINNHTRVERQIARLRGGLPRQPRPQPAKPAPQPAIYRPTNAAPPVPRVTRPVNQWNSAPGSRPGLVSEEDFMAFMNRSSQPARQNAPATNTTQSLQLPRTISGLAPTVPPQPVEPPRNKPGPVPSQTPQPPKSSQDAPTPSPQPPQNENFAKLPPHLRPRPQVSQPVSGKQPVSITTKEVQNGPAKVSEPSAPSQRGTADKASVLSRSSEAVGLSGSKWNPAPEPKVPEKKVPVKQLDASPFQAGASEVAQPMRIMIKKNDGVPKTGTAQLLNLADAHTVLRVEVAGVLLLEEVITIHTTWTFFGTIITFMAQPNGDRYEIIFPMPHLAVQFMNILATARNRLQPVPNAQPLFTLKEDDDGLTGSAQNGSQSGTGLTSQTYNDLAELEGLADRLIDFEEDSIADVIARLPAQVRQFFYMDDSFIIRGAFTHIGRQAPSFLDLLSVTVVKLGGQPINFWDDDTIVSSPLVQEAVAQMFSAYIYQSEVFASLPNVVSMAYIREKSAKVLNMALDLRRGSYNVEDSVHGQDTHDDPTPPPSPTPPHSTGTHETSTPGSQVASPENDTSSTPEAESKNKNSSEVTHDVLPQAPAVEYGLKGSQYYVPESETPDEEEAIPVAVMTATLIDSQSRGGAVKYSVSELLTYRKTPTKFHIGSISSKDAQTLYRDPDVEPRASRGTVVGTTRSGIPVVAGRGEGLSTSSGIAKPVKPAATSVAGWNAFAKTSSTTPADTPRSESKISELPKVPNKLQTSESIESPTVEPQGLQSIKPGASDTSKPIKPDTSSSFPRVDQESAKSTVSMTDEVRHEQSSFIKSEPQSSADTYESNGANKISWHPKELNLGKRSPEIVPTTKGLAPTSVPKSPVETTHARLQVVGGHLSASAALANGEVAPPTEPVKIESKSKEVSVVVTELPSLQTPAIQVTAPPTQPVTPANPRTLDSLDNKNLKGAKGLASSKWATEPEPTSRAATFGQPPMPRATPTTQRATVGAPPPYSPPTPQVPELQTPMAPATQMYPSPGFESQLQPNQPYVVSTPIYSTAIQTVLIPDGLGGTREVTGFIKIGNDTAPSVAPIATPPLPYVPVPPPTMMGLQGHLLQALTPNQSFASPRPISDITTPRGRSENARPL